MNKLASIYFLQSMGLHTVSPNIIIPRDERRIRRRVDSFYYEHGGGWVLRCGEFPDKMGKVERGLPWDIAYNKEELVKKISVFQKDVGNKYEVFCHPQNEMVKGGVMLVEGDRVVVESARGGPRELSAFYRGYRDPEQQIIFGPCMLSNKRSGENVLSNTDLLDIRNMHRKFNWSELNAVIDPFTVEFSRLEDGRFYVHDFSIIN